MEIENFKCSQTDSKRNCATWNTLFLSAWLTKEITNAQQNRNYYHKKQDLKNFKLWRNKTKDLIHTAKKGFFENAINEKQR